VLCETGTLNILTPCNTKAIRAMADAALATRVHTVLKQNPYLPGRQLYFETDQGKVVLRGTVGTYYQKQMAQEMVRSIEGVDHIENQLEVHWS
jgi:osmotically-inducible protein OsmY